MYYWSLAKLRKTPDRALKQIVDYLKTDPNITMQTAGAICQARRTFEKKTLNPEHKDLISRSLTLRQSNTMLLQPYELIHLKLITQSLKHNSDDCHEMTQRVASLLLTINVVPDTRVKSPLDMITHRFKRQGILGNYC
jgi:hypothetical protein